MGNSFFHFKQFSIHFQEKGLKVGTDACLLGVLSVQNNVVNCLDIGTGTGVIALMLAQRFPAAHIDAIEIEKTIADQATLNFSESSFKDRIMLIEGDFLAIKANKTYELITCNPPYFSSHLEKEDSEKNRAIHNKSLDMDSLIRHVISFMNESSKFYVIYPPYEASVFIAKANVLGLYCASKTEIYNIPGKHFRSIICLSMIEHPCIESSLFLYDENNKRSDEFNRLMKEFYLENTEIYKSGNK